MSESSLSPLGPSNYGLLGQLIADNQTIQNRLNTLSEQASSGYIANDFGGLGSGAAIALALTSETSQNTAIINSLNAASTTLNVTQTVLKQISSIASNFSSQILSASTVNANLTVLATSAAAALQQLAGLLNTQNGTNYVFAGTDSSNPPVPNAQNIASSGFATQIAAAVAGLGTNGAAATMASIQAIASSNAAGTSPFSTSLSQGTALLQTVPTGSGESMAIGVLANVNASQPSSAPYSSGSYMRDLMASLATIAAFAQPSVQAQANTPAFQSLLSSVQTLLNGAISGLATDEGVLGVEQNRISSVQSLLSDTNTALQTQISNVEDVNMAATLSNLSATQTQLEASYKLIASTATLSLANYL